MHNFGEHLNPDTMLYCPETDKLFQTASMGKAMASKPFLSIELDLLNVSVEVFRELNVCLSRIDFVRSKFTLVNNTDGTKDVGLASQEIAIFDTRDEKPFGDETDFDRVSSTNVFKNILQQSASTKVSLIVSMQ